MQEINTYLYEHMLELIAAFFGVLYVLLAARQNYLCWFSGIVNVSIFAVIFFEQKLFGNMSLQIIYLFLSFYGLYSWITKDKKQHAVISLMDNSYRYFMLILFLILTGIVYLTLQNSNSTLLMLDATTAAAGLVATWMQARKFIENWLIWIPTDLAIMGMFIFEGLYISAGLFLLYSIIAVFAYFKWKKELSRGVK